MHYPSLFFDFFFKIVRIPFPLTTNFCLLEFGWIRYNCKACLQNTGHNDPTNFHFSVIFMECVNTTKFYFSPSDYFFVYDKYIQFWGKNSRTHIYNHVIYAREKKWEEMICQMYYTSIKNNIVLGKSSIRLMNELWTERPERLEKDPVKTLSNHFFFWLKRNLPIIIIISSELNATNEKKFYFTNKYAYELHFLRLWPFAACTTFK